MPDDLSHDQIKAMVRAANKLRLAARKMDAAIEAADEMLDEKPYEIVDIEAGAKAARRLATRLDSIAAKARKKSVWTR
jgi:hypothetical protein